MKHVAEIEVVIAEVLEMGADLVWHLEGVQRRIQGEEAAIVGGDVQSDIAFVNGAEQAPEVEPDGTSGCKGRGARRRA